MRWNLLFCGRIHAAGRFGRMTIRYGADAGSDLQHKDRCLRAASGDLARQGQGRASRPTRRSRTSEPKLFSYEMEIGKQLMIRLSVEVRSCSAMPLFVSIASILAITRCITYTGSEEALTNAVYNQLDELALLAQDADRGPVQDRPAPGLQPCRIPAPLSTCTRPGCGKGYAELQASEIPPARDQALSNLFPAATASCRRWRR